MSKKDLQREIRQKEGMIVSEATLLNFDLLDSFWGIMEGYNLKTPIKKDIKNILNNYTEEEINYPLNISEELADHISWLINEDCFNYLNDIAPKKFYFGSQEGDGACFGFWKIEEEDY